MSATVQRQEAKSRNFWKLWCFHSDFRRGDSSGMVDNRGQWRTYPMDMVERSWKAHRILRGKATTIQMTNDRRTKGLRVLHTIDFVRGMIRAVYLFESSRNLWRMRGVIPTHPMTLLVGATSLLICQAFIAFRSSRFWQIINKKTWLNKDDQLAS